MKRRLAWLALLPACALGCTADIWEKISLASEGYNAILSERAAYVDAARGKDSWPGTRDKPKATVRAAMELVSRIAGTGDVRVAAGTYLYDGVLELRQGISLRGGYSGSNWTRNAAANLTVLQSSGGYAVSASGGNITRATVVDGFEIRAGVRNEPRCVLCVNGAAPVISNCTIAAGTGTVGGFYYPAAIVCDRSSPAIVGNTITGGSGDATVAIDLFESGATIEGNTISGGSAADGSWAIVVRGAGSSPLIRNNLISGGGPSGSAVGVWSESRSSARIQNNTVFGGRSDSLSVALHLAGGNAVVQNNLLFADTLSDAAIAIAVNLGCQPSDVRANDLFDCDHVYAYDNGAYSTASVTEMESYLAGAGVTTGGNVQVAPALADQGAGDWHLTPLSPASVRLGGLDLSAEFSTDAEGAARTAPWSMGAYELD